MQPFTNTITKWPSISRNTFCYLAYRYSNRQKFFVFQSVSFLNLLLSIFCYPCILNRTSLNSISMSLFLHQSCNPWILTGTLSLVLSTGQSSSMFLFVFFFLCGEGVSGTQTEMSMLFPLFFLLAWNLHVYARHASPNCPTLMLFCTFTLFPYNARTSDYLTPFILIQFIYHCFSKFCMHF